MQRAETAVLRMTNDKYRSIIFNAQVYANTGAGTYKKAVDMATRDFLSAGINCIEYKNGRRVNIRSYAEMALRTANKRAYLQGEGEMRKKWGIHTVIMNKRSNPCPKCAPFVGKVIVDDVWSGGTAEEATKSGYLLMSDCIAQGLYHPNCKDSHTTYFGDILDEEEEENDLEQTEVTPNDEIAFTPEEQKLSEQLYEAEQRENYCERQAEKFERLSKYSLDKNNQRIYKARKSEWKENNQRIYKARKSEWKEKLTEQKNIVHRLKGVANNLKSDIINNSYSKDVRKEVRVAFESELMAMTEKFGAITTISSVETLPENNNGVYGEFFDNSGVLAIRFANKKDCLSRLAQAAAEHKKRGMWSSAHPLHVIRHEIGHAIQLEHEKNDPFWKEKKQKIFSIMTSESGNSVSKYATDNIDEFISECIAESMTKKSRSIAKKVVSIILGSE